MKRANKLKALDTLGNFGFGMAFLVVAVILMVSFLGYIFRMGQHHPDPERFLSLDQAQERAEMARNEKCATCDVCKSDI